MENLVVVDSELVVFVESGGGVLFQTALEKSHPQAIHITFVQIDRSLLTLLQLCELFRAQQTPLSKTQERLQITTVLKITPDIHHWHLDLVIMRDKQVIWSNIPYYQLPFLKKIPCLCHRSQHIPDLLLTYPALPHSPPYEILQSVGVVVANDSDCILSDTGEDACELETVDFLEMLLLFGECSEGLHHCMYLLAGLGGDGEFLDKELPHAVDRGFAGGGLDIGVVVEREARQGGLAITHNEYYLVITKWVVEKTRLYLIKVPQY